MCRPLKEAYEELIISSMPEFQQKQLEYRVKKGFFLCVCVCAGTFTLNLTFIQEHPMAPNPSMTQFLS